LEDLFLFLLRKGFLLYILIIVFRILLLIGIICGKRSRLLFLFSLDRFGNFARDLGGHRRNGLGLFSYALLDG